MVILQKKYFFRSALQRGMTALRCYFFAIAIFLLSAAAQAQSVVFINPGKSDEAFWLGVSQVMQQAARSLEMDLEIIYAERSRTQPIRLVKEVVERPKSQRPQYLIVVNELRVAPELLRIAEGSGVKVFIAFSGIQEDQRLQTGKPGEKFPFWLGSLMPNAQEAGYMSAKALIEQARKQPSLRAADGKLHLVAIAGDRSTPVSVGRNEGMRKAVREAADVVLAQEVYAEWNKERAQEQAKVLYQRYPQTRLVWAGSDLMAFGAMNAWKEKGGVPGRDALFSGINTSQEALDARRSGQLSALAGGHFMAGAWALVMLYDHAKGVDITQGGAELELPMFTLLDEHNIPTFESRFVQLQSRVDFKKFSRFHQPHLKQYEFNFSNLLR